MGKSTTEKIALALRGFDAAVITGASSGIGAALLRCVFEFSNARIFAVSRTPPEILNSRVEHVAADLSDEAQLCSVAEKIAGEISSSIPRPKILLINNAGFGAYGEFPEPSLGRNLEMIDLNVKAPVALCGKFLPLMGAGSAIVNIASTAAFQPCPQLAVYAATKAFVASFTLGISDELKEAGVRCVCVCPGPTSSNFFRAAGFDSPPLPSGFGHVPEDVARAALLALGRGSPLTVVGVLNKIQTVLVRLLPIVPTLRLSGRILRKIRSVKPLKPHA